MEQQESVDRGSADLEPLARSVAFETGPAATSTVVAEGEWLAVSTDGFSEQGV